MSKKTSIADIAQSLGVSKTLVSLVINEKSEQYGISEETKKRVLEKIVELNYRPNILAQGFRTGKTHTLGLIVSDIANRFYSRIARKIEDLAWQHGYTVVICSTDENVDKELRQIRMLRDRKVDGIIISSSQNNSDVFAKLTEAGFPFVLIDRHFGIETIPSVSVDNIQGAQLAVNHLVQQGLTHIGMISISPQHISTMRERAEGFEMAMKKAGLTMNPDWCIRVPFENIESTLNQRIEYLKDTNNLPQAFFTLNNNLTSLTLMALRAMSVKIPQDIALLSFDDMLYFNFTNPSITAVEQPIEQLSVETFNLLLKQLKKEEIAPDERTVCLPVCLNVRESTKKRP
jgi:LacI family transcriptional regulator